MIRFGYERLADYQLARRLLDRHLGDVPEEAFSEGGPFRGIFSEENAYGLRGLLAAMIVLVPERAGREVADLMPYLRPTQAYRDAFLEALPWREGAHLRADAITFVEELLACTTARTPNAFCGLTP